MTRTVIRALCVLFVMTLPTLTSAQEEPAASRQMVSELQVDPAMQSDFEKHLKGMFTVAKEVGYSHPIHVAQWNTTYWLVAPMKNYASLDKIFADREMVWEKGGEKFQSHYKGMVKTLMNEHSWLSEHKPELSYHPEGSMSEDMMFMNIDSLKIKPGHWDEMTELLKEAKNIHGELGLMSGYDVYFEGLGAVGNQVTIISYAKDPLEMAKMKAATNEKMKNHAGWNDLMGRYMKISQSENEMRAWVRSDLAYMP